MLYSGGCTTERLYNGEVLQFVEPVAEGGSANFAEPVLQQVLNRFCNMRNQFRFCIGLCIGLYKGSASCSAQHSIMTIYIHRVGSE